jgi:uridine kinase
MQCPPPEPPSDLPPCVTIGIAGGSAGGKSTLARLLQDRAGHNMATLLELDRFYLPRADRQHQGATNFDRPEAVDLALVEKVVLELRQNGRSDVPIYDFASHDRIGYESIIASPLIIIEGILALWHAPLRNELDLKLYVDASNDDRLARRIDRDGRERGRSPASVRQQWFESVLPMHERFVLPTKAYADRVIDGCEDLEPVAIELLESIGR